jgi:site-specific DNA recombinase
MQEKHSSRVADLYVRVSTDRQTVQNQIDYAAEWAPRHGYDIREIHSEDDTSGTVPFAERRAARRLLADVRSGTVKTVLVYKYDRLGRDKDVGDIEVRQAILDIERAGGEVVSMTQYIDTSTTAGKFARSIQIDVGAIERRDTLERSSDAIAQLARVADYYPGGTVPYGYAVVGEDREARLVIDEEPIDGLDIGAADIVRLIYRWIADEGRSTVWVAAELNRRGIPTKYALDIQRGQRKGRTAGIWRPNRISEMTRNTTYKGIAVYGKAKLGTSPFPVPVTERAVPALVDVDTWERAQATLRRNFKHAKRNRKRDYLLSGLVTCGACGAAYTGKHYVTAAGEERQYYTCNHVHQHHNTGGERCSNPALSWEYEAIIWADIDGWMEDPGPIIDELAERINAEASDGEDVQADIDKRRRALAATEGQKARMLTAYRKGIIDDAELEAELAAIRQETFVLEDEIEALEHHAERLAARRTQLVTARALLEDLQAMRRDGLTFARKRQAVETLVSQIIVDGDGIPDVVYRFNRGSQGTLRPSPSDIDIPRDSCAGTAGAPPRHSRTRRLAVSQSRCLRSPRQAGPLRRPLSSRPPPGAAPRPSTEVSSDTACRRRCPGACAGWDRAIPRTASAALGS